MKIYNNILYYSLIALSIASVFCMNKYPSISKILFISVVMIFLLHIVFKMWILKDKPKLIGEVTNSWTYHNNIVTEIEIKVIYNDIEYVLNKKVDSHEAPPIGTKVEVTLYPEHPEESFINI